ncbi:hypothetical protein GCM10009612_77030 [Streptomyces beijiangensis]
MVCDGLTKGQSLPDIQGTGALVLNRAGDSRGGLRAETARTCQVPGWESDDLRPGAWQSGYASTRSARHHRRLESKTLQDGTMCLDHEGYTRVVQTRTLPVGPERNEALIWMGIVVNSPLA